ncbi:hypothetical protein L226DRAFT_486796 [Lentinus tigrinus ALCF2SS1-7]|uniref:uncharacterized protein n=1 Tax=Lentinus tigrinus ALCF2SS1-7 TaxID=1328758 RepID=UPI001165E5A1|nr:hypothetical protein L226DRAFT_486796 [Lentinus tigrinus ALCF2SS1-7]
MRGMCSRSTVASGESLSGCDSPTVQARLDALPAYAPSILLKKGLLVLSDDVIRLVIDCLEDDPILEFVDIVCFAVTCRRIFAVARSTIDAKRGALAARWAYCRVACIGENARYSDLPQNVLTDEERAVVEGRITTSKDQGHDVEGGAEEEPSVDVASEEGGDNEGTPKEEDATDDDDSDGESEDDDDNDDEEEEGDLDARSYGGLFPGFRLEFREYSKGERLLLGEFQWPNWNLNGAYSHSTRLMRMTELDRKAFREVFMFTYPERDDWVLVNLDKKLYVRAAALAELAGAPEDEQPFLPTCKMDLGHALLTRILWSSDQTVDMDNSIDIHRGPWAGDRFCITTLERCEKRFDIPGQWKDVSGEILADLIAIHGGGEKAAVILETVVPSSIDDYGWYASDGDDLVSAAGHRALSFQSRLMIMRHWFEMGYF